MIMGVSGLQKLIEQAKNIEACSPKQALGGKLIIDGNDLLHELYRDFHLDWAHGGQYPQLHRVVTEFFTALCSQGVQPIVVVDGGGDEVLVDELVYRRNRSIEKLPEDRKNELSKPHRDTRHYLPILAGVVFRHTIVSLRHRIPLCVADGKADPTIVQLANDLSCPVLGCDGNYYIYNLTDGFIHYQHLEWRSGRVTARVYRQLAFAQHFGLCDPKLSLLLPALLGDGCDISIKYIYGALKPLLAQDVSKCEAILNFARQYRSYEQLIQKLEHLSLGWRAKENIRNNCAKAKRLYVVSSTLSQERLMRQPCQVDLPREVLAKYREGGFLPSLLTAVVVRRCPLHYQIGDQTLPPPPAMSRTIRQVTYGLLSGLSCAPGLNCVKEYYRNGRPHISGELKYAEHSLQVTSDRFPELSITNAGNFPEEERSILIRQLFSSILVCPSEVIDRFDNWEDKNWVLPVAATKFWAMSLQQANQTVRNLAQVVKALVLSFVSCHSHLEMRELESNWKDPSWGPTHHAFLQWQCVWYDVIGLNQALCEPFETPSPSALFDGPLALHYATHVDARAVDTATHRLSPDNKQLYDKLLAAVLPGI